MSDYKVSILISSYNYAHVIGETFESIRNQTFNFDDIEVIFVDDKSSDNSVEVIQEFVDKYENSHSIMYKQVDDTYYVFSRVEAFEDAPLMRLAMFHTKDRSEFE